MLCIYSKATSERKTGNKFVIHIVNCIHFKFVTQLYFYLFFTGNKFAEGNRGNPQAFRNNLSISENGRIIYSEQEITKYFEDNQLYDLPLWKEYCCLGDGEELQRCDVKDRQTPIKRGTKKCDMMVMRKCVSSDVCNSKLSCAHWAAPDNSS
jgi:hypothetical protein